MPRWAERTIADRFWEKVEIRGPDECWHWRASGDGHGYGRFTIDARRRARKAHRVAFFVTHGRWPTACVLHTCDTPACQNPAHLVEGTQLDNIADMRAKGRVGFARGSAVGTAKLDDRTVQVIRLLVGRIGCTQREVAARYGVSVATISNVANARIWRHVPEITP